MAEFWPTTLEGITTVAANAIAIVTFLFTRNAVVSWATSLRREVGAARFSLPGQPPPRQVTIQHAQIQMERRVGPGTRDWKITWTEAGRKNRESVAEIRSFRLRFNIFLRQTLGSHKTDFPIVGEVRYLLTHDDEIDFVEVTRLDFIPGDWFSRWVVAPLAGASSND